ncbi:MAG TPA: NADPH-dependent F420 reductase [Acidimicrobiales bacterium]|jgi:NADPH-dependent F420 reductase|nr:NADPH-dependent F420 reductase [Acidimicrobiales bacterium]
MRIGVLGATGPQGSGLAARLASLGHTVVLGSRAVERAEQARNEILDAWPGHELDIEAGDNKAAAAAEVVVVATPWEGAPPTVMDLADELDGKVVISMANALTKIGKSFQPIVPARGSVAAEIQAAIPRSRVAAAWQNVPAAELGAIDHPVECDVMVCGDDPEARKVTSGLVDEIPGMRAVDAGRLSSAGAIEALTAVLVGMNVRYKTRLSIRLTGLPE